MTPALALTVVRKMIPQLVKSGIVLVLSMAIMQVSRELGIILMMAYSSFMVVKSAKRKMPLGRFTALLPGTISLFCFLFMLAFIGVGDVFMPLAGIGLGLIPGFFMARGHKIYDVGGKPFAQRTYLYILIWAISLLFTQGATLLGLRQVMDFGFLLNGFSTTMAVILSAFLFIKARSTGTTQPPTGSTTAALLLLAFSTGCFAVLAPQANAFNITNPKNDPAQILKAGRYVFQSEVERLEKLGGRKTDEGLKNAGTYKLAVESATTGNQGVLVSGAQVKMALTYTPSSKENWNESIQGLDWIYNKKMQTGGAVRKGRLQNDGDGYYWVMSEIRNNLDDVIEIIGIWKYRDWVVSYMYTGVPTQNKNLLQVSPIADFQRTMRTLQQRVKRLGTASSPSPQPAPQPTPQPQPQPTPQPTPQPQPQPQPAPQPQPQPQPDPTLAPDPVTDSELEQILNEVLAAMENALHNVGFSEGAVAAGLSIALVQLLAGLGMTAAYTAAVEVAGAVDLAVIEATEEAAAGSGAPPAGQPPGECGPTLTDENGDPWYCNENGEYGIENADGETVWMSREEAEKSIQDELDSRRQRDRERQQFWEDVDKDKEMRRQERAEELTNGGFVYDPDRQAWVRPEMENPYESKVEEMYSRSDYIEEHYHELTDKQQQVADRVMDRANAAAHGLDEDDITEENLKDMRDLSNAVFQITTGGHQTDMAQAEHEAISESSRIKKAKNLITGGKMAATFVETQTLPWTKGAISGLVYGGMDEYVDQEPHERDYYEIVKNSLITAGSNVGGGKLGDLNNSSVLWNASTGALVDGAETAIKGGTGEEIKTSMQFGFAMNGLFTHVQNVDSNNTHLLDFSGRPARTDVDVDVEAPSAPTRSTANLDDGPGSRATDIGENATDIGTRGHDISEGATDIGMRAERTHQAAIRDADAPPRPVDLDGGLSTSTTQTRTDIEAPGAKPAPPTDQGIDPNATRPAGTDEAPDSIDLLQTRSSGADQGVAPNANRHAGSDPKSNATQSPADGTDGPPVRASEEEVLQGIRDKVARNEVVSRAEAASQDGEIHEPGRKLSDTTQEWNEWDKLHEGAIRERLSHGIDRTPVIQEAIDTGQAPWLDHADTEIRKAWQMSDFNKPKGWDRFEVQLQERNISMNQFEQWLKISQGQKFSSGGDTAVVGAGLDPNATR